MKYTSVAVVTDSQGNLARFSGNALVTVYHKHAEGWICGKSIRFCVEPGQDMAGMRNRLRDLVEALGRTRILLAASISGVACSALDQRGFRLCEMDGFSPEEPDVLDALAERASAPARSAPAPRPVEISPGVYQCDLLDILGEYPDLSSKKILRPFFNETPFAELRITCSHIPPWLLPELKERGLEHDGPAPESGRLRLRVRPAACV
ncbi:MAG: hypothetical protein LBQ10_02365 [Desulfovibrio sp.]|jgi:Fe-only nitrogenase accessory protein AnfO|nr:hypothetical protein [Desulfovibrio sp.]